MKTFKLGFKQSLDRLLAQHVFALEEFTRPPFSDELLRYIRQQVKLLRNKRVLIDDKLNKLQNILDCIHIHSAQALHDAPVEKQSSFILWRRMMVFEVLCKELSRFNLKNVEDKVYLNLPSETLSNNNTPMCFTHSHRLIKQFELKAKEKSNKGLPFYILIPQSNSLQKTLSLPHLFLFPGTNFKNFTSVLANGNMKGPGRNIYAQSKNLLETLFQSAPSVRLSGYSQGAAMALRLMLDYPERLCHDPNFPSIIFNAPGLEADFLDKYYSDTPRYEKIPFLQFSSFADPVSKVGKLIGEVFEINSHSHKEKGFPWRHHIGCKSFHPQSTLKKVDIEKENSCKVRYHYRVITNLIAHYQAKVHWIKNERLMPIVQNILKIN